MTQAVTADYAMALAARHSEIGVTRLEVSPIRANCYLLNCRATGEVLVVDAGGDGDRILAAIDEQTGGARERVRQIVSTHGHIDHVAAVAELRAALGPIPVAMHPDGIELVEGNGPDAERFMKQPYVPIRPDRLVRDGDEIAWGACTLRVIETPGHSPDGISLYGHGLALTGDTLFRRSVGAWKFFKGNKEDLFASLHRLAALPPETVVYSGHGEPTTIEEERAENKYLQRRDPGGKEPIAGRTTND
jgi:glyoxylase-like metal-dependent hydrolase (beta-lactamase superfamily II)